ncbi:LysR family transcriptional regulator [Pandoraea captiosa]|uniref:LysR family transcriptional regulator n=1 Tax=Pandoraea captiosa TaxID=2508302 RepID=A0A5E4ZHK0_9BURK|nr:LysR family transcriptional regulator [Pandoraea captiosa]
MFVVESRGFAQAGERLALTPSAVSGHIRRLEGMVGARLLERTTRRLQVTLAGETLLAYARNIVDLEREAVARLKGDPISGRIRVGASEDFAGAWLPGVLHAFQRWHPQASIELKVGITTDLLKQQARGKIDLVFGKRCALSDTAGELLWEEPLVWAYAAHAPFTQDVTVPLAVFPEPCIYRESAIAALGAAARPWRVALESSSMAGCISAARSGFAVAPIAQSQMRSGLRELTEHDGMPALPFARFYAFTRESRPTTQALLKAAREAGGAGKFYRWEM